MSVSGDSRPLLEINAQLNSIRRDISSYEERDSNAPHMKEIRSKIEKIAAECVSTSGAKVFEDELVGVMYLAYNAKEVKDSSRSLIFRLFKKCIGSLNVSHWSTTVVALQRKSASTRGKFSEAEIPREVIETTVKIEGLEKEIKDIVSQAGRRESKLFLTENERNQFTATSRDILSQVKDQTRFLLIGLASKPPDLDKVEEAKNSIVQLELRMKELKQGIEPIRQLLVGLESNCSDQLARKLRYITEDEIPGITVEKLSESSLKEISSALSIIKDDFQIKQGKARELVAALNVEFENRVSREGSSPKEQLGRVNLLQAELERVKESIRDDQRRVDEIIASADGGEVQQPLKENEVYIKVISILRAVLDRLPSLEEEREFTSEERGWFSELQYLTRNPNLPETVQIELQKMLDSLILYIGGRHQGDPEDLEVRSSVQEDIKSVILNFVPIQIQLEPGVIEGFKQVQELLKRPPLAKEDIKKELEGIMTPLVSVEIEEGNKGKQPFLNFRDQVERFVNEVRDDLESSVSGELIQKKIDSFLASLEKSET